MNKKQFILSFTFFLAVITAGKAQSIPPNFFGQNAWFTFYTNDGSPINSSDAFVNYINDVKASGAKYCRIGGAQANILGNYVSGAYTNIPITKSQIRFLIRKIRAAGMEPIIQVPYINPNNDNSALATEALNAADIVNDINILNASSLGGPVKTWIIANEPDKNLSGSDKIGYDYNENLTTSPTEIAKYIKQFAIEMRKKDPTINIIGPELASTWHHFFFSGTYPGFNASPFDGLIDGTANDITGLIGTTDVLGNPTPVTIQGRPYIDYLSFHYYGTSSSTSAVINNIHSTADDWKLKKLLVNLNAACTSGAMIAKRTSVYPLRVAITEANLKIPGAITDTDQNSFLRGQWWCDFMRVCLAQNVAFVNFWSSAESDYGAMQTNGTKRSTYYHFQMMATRFKGSFFDGTTSNSDIKAFASRTCEAVYVMIMNEGTSSVTYNMNLNGNAPTATGVTTIQIGTPGNGAAPRKGITGTIPPETTWLIRVEPCVNPLGYYSYSETSTSPSGFIAYTGVDRFSCGCVSIRDLANGTARCATDTSHTQGIIPQDTVVVDSMQIRPPGSGVLKVPAGVTLTIKNALVTVAAGASIELQPGTDILSAGRLVILHSTLQGCDGATWAGIVANGRGDSAQVVIDSSSVYDALNVLQSKGSRNSSITNSWFVNGLTGIYLDSSRSFRVSGNTFIGYIDAIKTNRTLAGISSISHNTIQDITNGVISLNDNHSQLDVNCNEFNNYSAYAVKSINSTLKDQGTSVQGAGNTFVSSSALLNNEFSHSGNNMTYYTDPSSPFTLVTGLGMNATTIAASANGCGFSARAIQAEEARAEWMNENKAGIINTVPNPNNGRATIYFNLGKEKASGEVLITNLFGSIVSRYPVAAAFEKVDIDCSAFANGVYFTTLVVDGKPISSKKMMIAK